MSRGLGRVERFILSWLASEKQHEADLWALSHAVAGNVDCPRCLNIGLPLGSEFSAATYKAVARAVKSLERKGFVAVEKVYVDGWRERPGVGEHGGISRRVVVRLSVDTNAVLRWYQHLPCEYGYDDENEGEEA